MDTDAVNVAVMLAGLGGGGTPKAAEVGVPSVVVVEEEGEDAL